MNNNLTECPQCLNAKEIMVPKQTKGFEYKTCNLCKGTGQVDSQIADDFVFAMNEDNFETNDDW